MKLVGNSWDIELEDETSKPYFMELLEKVDKEYQNHVVYPKQHNVFNALKYTPFENIKVVILGQDPYHGAGQAHGLCFSVQPGVEPPPSLKNIYKEIENDIGCKMSNSGYLASWAKQGVLLLNTILTVEEGKPQSHKNFGWQQWTDAIIKKISDKKSGVVFCYGAETP